MTEPLRSGNSPNRRALSVYSREGSRHERTGAYKQEGLPAVRSLLKLN